MYLPGTISSNLTKFRDLDTQKRDNQNIMGNNRRIILPIVVVLVLAGIGYYVLRASSDGQGFTLSGTIEATEINVETQIGGRVKKVYVAEGDDIQQGENLVDIYRSNGNVNEKVNAPIDGVVLQRLIEPGELAAAGSTLLVVADLNALTLKVYVPEDRYGQITMGESYPVTVDSFPGETFSGRVSYIANKAEFTPKNVQTTDGRRTTVFAVKLDLVGANGRLKPGMPADVHFQFGQ